MALRTWRPSAALTSMGGIKERNVSMFVKALPALITVQFDGYGWVHFVLVFMSVGDLLELVIN